MKNSIIYIGIALVSLVSTSKASNIIDHQKNSFQAEILGENNISNGTQILKFNRANSDSTDLEIIESANTNKTEKTPEELIAEDNAITENNLSNETQTLDFNFINSNSIVDEVIESANPCTIEKTSEELIAEDNAITENNISNEIFALDFKIINRHLNFVIRNNKFILENRLKS